MKLLWISPAQPIDSRCRYYRPSRSSLMLMLILVIGHGCNILSSISVCGYVYSCYLFLSMSKIANRYLVTLNRFIDASYWYCDVSKPELCPRWLKAKIKSSKGRFLVYISRLDQHTRLPIYIKKHDVVVFLSLLPIQEPLGLLNSDIFSPRLMILVKQLPCLLRNVIRVELLVGLDDSARHSEQANVDFVTELLA